jgi:hypothetical protein
MPKKRTNFLKTRIAHDDANFKTRIQLAPKPKLEISYNDSLGDVTRNIDLPPDLLQHGEEGLEKIEHLAKAFNNYMSYVWQCCDDYHTLKTHARPEEDRQHARHYAVLVHHASKHHVDEFADMLGQLLETEDYYSVLDEAAKKMAPTRKSIVRSLRDVMDEVKLLKQYPPYESNCVEKDIDEIRMAMMPAFRNIRKHIEHHANIMPGKYPEEALLAAYKDASEALIRALDATEEAWLDAADAIYNSHTQVNRRYISIDDAEKLSNRVKAELDYAHKAYAELKNKGDLLAKDELGYKDGFDKVESLLDAMDDRAESMADAVKLRTMLKPTPATRKSL